MEAERMSLAQIKRLDMVVWLSDLGFEPVSVKKGFEYWYRSPLRGEANASFKVNSLRNQWYDFGLAVGGNLVDFGLRYYGCTAAELPGHFSADSGHRVHLLADKPRPFLQPQLVIMDTRPIFLYPLKNYLHERGIPVAVADDYCCEVHYMVNGRKFYGISFKNDAGGYEIRNKMFKASSSPKEITTLRFGAPSVQVFEGFFDMLSWRVLHPDDDPRLTDLVVLNSAALFQRALPFLLEHERVHLWLDRDVTGQRHRDYALSLGGRFVDESGLYRHFKDLNEWLCHKGKRLEKRIKLKVGGL